jgi:hypothetical protein
MAISRSAPLHAQRGPLQDSCTASRRCLRVVSAHTRLLSVPRHRGQIVICAASDKNGPKQPEAPSPLIKAARQLAGATALAAVTVRGQLLAAVVGTGPRVDAAAPCKHTRLRTPFQYQAVVSTSHILVQGSMLQRHASIHGKLYLQEQCAVQVSTQHLTSTVYAALHLYLLAAGCSCAA